MDCDSLRYNVTFHGLHRWHKAMFEKLGWMLLAQRDGFAYRVNAYQQGVKDLLAAIEEKLNCTQDEDRKKDLLILHKNVKTLLQHVKKDFKVKRNSLRK